MGGVLTAGRRPLPAVAFVFTSALSRATSADPPPGPTEEIEVRGQRSELGKTSLRATEVRELPGAFGDAFRAIEALPGVTPIVSGLPFFYVRGAPPGNTGYYLDGVRVPLLYHLGFGPSVVHPGLVHHVDFYAGAFPARFGRFAGGILSGETRARATDLHGEASARFVDAGVLVETPFADGRGSALVAGRYSYTALLLTLLAGDTRVDYWDYQARVTWDVGPRDTIGAFLFGSYDFLGQRDRTGAMKEVLGTQFHRLDLRWDRRLAPDADMRLALTLGHDYTGTASVTGVRDRSIGVRFAYEKRVSPTLRVRAGADTILDHYDLVTSARPARRPAPGAPGPDSGSAVDSSGNETERVYPPRNDVVTGLWADVVWRITPRVEIVPGLRADHFGSVQSHPELGDVRDPRAIRNGSVPSIDPRFATRIQVSSGVTHVAQIGVSHQPPSFFVPVPGLQVGQLKSGLQTSIGVSHGLEIDLPWSFTAAPTVFVQNYLGMTDFATSCNGTARDTDDDCVNRRVTGRTYGLELLVKRAITARWTGWIAYTLSRTTRQTHALTYVYDARTPLGGTDANGALRPIGRLARTGEIAGEMDRTHVLNVVMSYDLGGGFRAGGRFFFYTGTPYSREVSGLPLPPYNAERMPSFHRVDARFEKRWRAGKTGRVSLVLEWLNATLRKEAVGLDCDRDPEGGPIDRCTPRMIGPITVPSIGVEGGF